MKTGEVIFNEFNKWVYNDENQAGDKLQVIDASDLPEIITKVVKKLTIPAIVKSLPTDEEISKQAKKYDVEDMNDAINRIGGFIVGAKWMRDLISGNDR